jgi:hypothetical protein
MTHGIIAILFQAVFGLAFGLWWVAAAAVSAFYMGREHAQAEYRVISAYYNGKRANMPWFGGFEPKAWTPKSLFDWLIPTTATIVVAVCLT